MCVHLPIPLNIVRDTLITMWHNVMQVNSVLLALSAIYLIYSIGTALLNGTWKQLLLAFLLFAFFVILEIVIAAIRES